MTNTSELLTIKQAAQMLGVTPLTLRNWDKRGKLKPTRHPLNNYRVYKRKDIEKLLSDIGSNTEPVVKPSKKPRKLIVQHLEE
jgi:MerR family copper efflux transcriptional regulator